MPVPEETYEDIDKDGIIEELITQNKKLQVTSITQAQGLASYAGINKDPNLAQFQIDSSELLDKLERFYKGERLTYDAKGQPFWKTPTDKDEIPLNEFGVSSMMEIVTKYVDRNTILSYYSDKRIYEILGDLGEELTLFILSNYEKLGMDTYFKKTKYRLIVVSTLHLVESAYRRALFGRTIQEINQSRIITQSDVLGNNPQQIMQQKQKRGFLSRFGLN